MISFPQAAAFATIEPLEARIAPATFSIADVQITEGDSGNSIAVFTVTLSEATSSAATVNFATSDDSTAGAAKTTGAFADYVAKTGTLTFAAGTTTQTIEISILGDTYKEADEVFKVTLSNASAGNTIASGEATGTILNGADTTVGLAMPDVQATEGNSSTKTFTFIPELSIAQGTATAFTATTLNGSAVAGSDFVANTATVTIAAGATTGTFAVVVNGDNDFEQTESFFASLSGLPAGITPVTKTVVGGGSQVAARGYILSDDTRTFGTNQVQWIDVDGDLVTLTVSKGFAGLSLTLDDAGTTGGKQLKLVDLASAGKRFAGTNLTITAEKQLGSPIPSDGRVDVGTIRSAFFVDSELQVVGVDLGTVTVDGDLGRIQAGDQFSTPAIAKLDVYSLGARGTATQDTGDNPSTESRVLGPIGTVKVKTDLQGFLHVIGAEFGTIGTLEIDGALRGGAADVSGAISVSGRISNATIGEIVGGAGKTSGYLVGSNISGLTGGSFGNITVLGNVTGGDGELSGSIGALKIANLKIGGALIGDDGALSGSVRAFTGNLTTATIGKNSDGDSIKGGAGLNSGRVEAALSIGSLTLAGDLQGGAKSGSGVIVGGLSIDKLVIKESVRGGSAGATEFVNRTGYISTVNLKSATISGDVVSGTAGAGGLANSGAIRADVIGMLSIQGNLVGTAAVPVFISASGQGNALAIKTLTVGGSARFAEILAGYNDTVVQTDVVAGKSARGTGTSADASIGTIMIGGAVQAINVVAGVAPGADLLFASPGGTTADDKPLSSAINSSARLSTITSLIIKGAIEADTTAHGVVAQSIGSIRVGPLGTAVSLLAGPLNDATATVINATDPLFRVFEADLT